MYKIYADNTLIYDSTLEDYKIGKGVVTRETNKSGSFVFSLYPDHFFYDRFIKLKTVTKVLKSNKIVFRGRILKDVSNYWNNKEFTCEGELGFLQDSIIRPFDFSGTPEDFVKKIIDEHNSQVDDFKKFNIGKITISNSNVIINRKNTGYESALTNLNKLISEDLGGYFFITHGDDETDEMPTLNYLADFIKVSSQTIEFGSNLKNYTKTSKAESIATAIIPIGAEISEGNKLTIAEINDGLDYVYSAEGAALYGWIFKSVVFDKITDPYELKQKAEEYVDSIVNQNITIELTAIDLHLINHSIESFNCCDYIRIVSPPHNFDSTLLCNKQTLDLLKPENDSIVLGYTYSTFTESTAKTTTYVQNINRVNSVVNKVSGDVAEISEKTAKKITYNGISDCTMIAFALANVEFDSQGVATVDISEYLPENYTLASCFAQIENTTGAVIASVSRSGTTITIVAYEVGGATFVSTIDCIQLVCVCQKNIEPIDEGDE